MKAKTCILSLCVSLIGIVGHPAVAQDKATDPGEMALKYAGILAGNRAALSGYSWQLRVEVAKGGELQYIDLVQGRYDASGRLQTTEINQDLKVKKRHGLIRGNLQEKKIRELKASVDKVKNMVLSYIYMSRGDVVNFFDRARKSVAPAYDNVLVIDSKNVLLPGDAVTLLVDKMSGSPLRLVFSAPAGEKRRVNATIQFRHLRNNAAFYADQADVRVITDDDDDNLAIKVESFDFMKQL
jgi:hypothetical protein